MYKPKTVEEIVIHTIEVSSRKIRKGVMTLKQANLNKWFAKLKVINPGMYDDMYPKYIKMVKELYKQKN